MLVQNVYISLYNSLLQTPRTSPYVIIITSTYTAITTCLVYRLTKIYRESPGHSVQMYFTVGCFSQRMTPNIKALSFVNSK